MGLVGGLLRTCEFGRGLWREVPRAVDGGGGLSGLATRRGCGVGIGRLWGAVTGAVVVAGGGGGVSSFLGSTAPAKGGGKAGRVKMAGSRDCCFSIGFRLFAF